MEKSFLLPSLSIFDGAQPIDCIRKSLIALTTAKQDPSNIMQYLDNIKDATNNEISNILLDDLLLVIRQCFETTNADIIAKLDLFIPQDNFSRTNLLISLVGINAIIKANPEYKFNEKTVSFLKEISEEIAPKFHSFKPKNSYNVKGITLGQNEAISGLILILKTLPIDTETLLESMLYLWHYDVKPVSTINFIDLIEKVDSSVYQSLFNSIPRERFLFLCADPSAPSTICPSIAEKLNDFSDIPFFLRALPLPQAYISNDAIASAIQSITDCHILSARLRHPLLQKIETWVDVLGVIEEETIGNSAKCFVCNIVDVADSLGQLILALPKITVIACKFIDEVLNQDTEARSQLSRSEMISYIISNLEQPPPLEFWQMIYSPEPFKYIDGIKDGRYPVALLGLIYYLIVSNQIFKEQFFPKIELPSIKEESTVALYDYISALDGTPETLFGKLPKDSNVILLAAFAIYSALNYEVPKHSEILHHNKHNVLPFLTIQLYAIKSIVKSPSFIEGFLMQNQDGFDSLQEIVQELSDPISDLDDLCLCTIFDILSKYHPFYYNPIVVVNIILLSSYVWAHHTVAISKGISNRFCKALILLDEVLIKKPHGNRVGFQIQTLFTRLGKGFLSFLLNNEKFFVNKKLNINHFYVSKEACSEACSSFFSENSTIETIRFFQSCFTHPPKITIDSPEKVNSIYQDIVAKEQWTDASYLSGFLSNCGKLDLIQQTPDEVINILIHSRVPFDEKVPKYLLNLIQNQFSDDDTQLNAMVNYFNSIPDISPIEIAPLLINFSKFFHSQHDKVSKALSVVFSQGLDPSLPLVRRPENLPIPEPSEKSVEFFNKLIDSVISNPSQKMFVFLRAVIIVYAFLLRKVPTEKVQALTETCFTVIDGLNSLELKSTNADHFNQIQASILLLSILLCDPSYCDFFFTYVSQNINNFSASRIYITLNFLNAIFGNSRFLSAIATSYFFKTDLLENISSNVVRVQDETKLKNSIISSYNSLVSNTLTFFTKLADIDIIDIDDSLKSEKPFTTLVQPGLLRSALSLTAIQAFGPFEIDEDKNHYSEMAQTILPPISGPEFDMKGFLSTLKEGNFKPADVESYIGFLPEGIKPDLFKAMTPRDRAICLRDNLPRLDYITPPMMRVLIKQPSWVKTCILQNIPGLLLPEHYITLIQVIQEMKNVKDDSNLSELRKQFIEKALCQSNYFKFVTFILSQKNIKKEVLIDALDNLSKMVSFGPALNKCMEIIAPLLKNAQNTDDLMTVYTIIMVMAKTGASSEKIYSLLGEDFFIYFLQPKWRNDREKLEYISALVSTFLEKSYHKDLVLPTRILYLICFLYMNDCYKSANHISLYLTDAQKKSISPFIHNVFEHLKKLNVDDEYQIDLMNLCRAYPYLNFDKSRILNTMDLLLSTDSPNLEVLGSLINVLLPDDYLEVDESDEPQEDSPNDKYNKLSFPIPRSIYKKYPEFWHVISNHRLSLTKIAHSLRFSQNATSPFKFLFMFPIIIDHKIKADYFNYKNKKALEAIPSTTFEVQNEQNVLHDSIEMFKAHPYEEWRKSFSPTILNSDKDWYEEVCKELFTSDLFTLTPNNRCVQINASNENIDMYRFAGFFIGLCLLHNKKINAHLAPHIFKHILGLKPTLRDVEIIDVALARSYRHILEKPASDLGLFFTATTQVNGKNVEIELIKDGNKTPVNEENKVEYIRRILDFKFSHECQKQLDAIKEGFYTLISSRDIHMFNAQELEMLVCGVPNIDIKEMMNNVIIVSPYSIDHPVIKMFFSMLKKWDQATLAKLLWFITGSSELPIGGFEELRKRGMPIQIERGIDITFTPTAHTCFQTLVIPEYPTLDIMERMFFIALDKNM